MKVTQAVLLLFIISLIGTPLTEQRAEIGTCIESDKGKRVIRLRFGAVREVLIRKFYGLAGWTGAVARGILYPDEVFLWGKKGDMERLRKEHPVRARKGDVVTRKNRAHDSIFTFILAWLRAIYYSTPMYVPTRVILRNRWLKEKRKARSAVQAFCITSLGFKAFHATDYYFSAAGSDSNNGLTEGAPKQTISGGGLMYGELPLTGDDAVYFRKGDDFTAGQNGTQFIQTIDHGTSGHPITFSAYGTGADPIIPTIMGTSDATGCYWHLDGVHVVPMDADDHCIYIDRQGTGTGMFVDNCTLDTGPNGVVSNMGWFAYACSNTEISNTVINTGNAGIGWESGTAGVGGTNVVHDCTIHGGAGDGVCPHSNGGSSYLGSGYYIFDNTIYDMGESAVELGGAPEDNYVYHNILYGDGESLIGTGYWSDDMTFFQNFMQYSGAGSLFNHLTGDMVVYNNIIEKISGGDAVFGVVSTAGWGAYPLPTIKAYHNTVTFANPLDNGVIAFFNEQGAWTTTSDSISFRNNIFCTKSSNGATMVHRGNGTIDLTDDWFDCDYNCWYGGSTAFSANDSNGTYNWTQWQAAGFDANGLNVDPKLTDRTQTDMNVADYVLAADSPCINTAIQISTGTYYYYDDGETNQLNSGTGISLDYLGYARSAYDMGALEYGSEPFAIPEVTTMAATSIGSSNATGNGTITDIGDGAPSVRGFRVNTSATAIGATTFSSNGTFAAGAYSISLTPLTEGTTYYYQAYATNAGGTGNGSWVSFETDTPPQAFASGLRLNNVMLRWT